ncbi:hypothetical protein [Corynebacterium glutamicum]|nr:hypothetical protein [Corynebacterium glutamicum]
MMENNLTAFGVAVIALFGVLISTYLTNKAADKRRLADQQAADKRRQEDQKAEGERRRADQDAAEKRRQEDIAAAEARRQQDRDDRGRERREQLDRELRISQRAAVAECIKTINSAARQIDKLVLEKAPSGNFNVEILEALKGAEILIYHQKAQDALILLDLEVYDAEIRVALEALWDALINESTALEKAKNQGGAEWLKEINNLTFPSADIQKKIRSLQVIAQLVLVEHPNNKIAAEPAQDDETAKKPIENHISSSRSSSCVTHASESVPHAPSSTTQST